MARIVIVFCLIAGLAVILIGIRALVSDQPLANRPAVAVLPFSGSPDPQTNYLSIALAEELALLLSRSSQLAVRPFSQTRYYTDPEDLSHVAHELRVELLLTGDYQLLDDKLKLSLEIINGHNNTLVWREHMVMPWDNPLSWSVALSSRVNTAVLPALGLNPEIGPSLPANAQAYELYLKSLELSEDPGPAHQEAIEMLEQSLDLDPNYAPAWDALARRLYLNSQAIGIGGNQAFRRTEIAQQRAVDLDPNLIEAATGLTNMRTERGELEAAYNNAIKTLEHSPNSALAHFSLSYVLRYMGQIDDAVQACEMAYGLDPQLRIRSCALTQVMAGNLERAHDYLDLAGSSAWVDNKRAAVYLRQGRIEQALELWQALPPDYSGASFWAACLQQEERLDLTTLATQAEVAAMKVVDPEPKYWDAARHAYCRQSSSALRLLEAAVDQNYCAYPFLDTDPLWDGLRETPEFPGIRDKAIACHERFESLRQTSS